MLFVTACYYIMKVSAETGLDIPSTHPSVDLASAEKLHVRPRASTLRIFARFAFLCILTIDQSFKTSMVDMRKEFRVHQGL